MPIPGPTVEAMDACAHEWGAAARGRDAGSRHGKGPGSTLTGSRTRYDLLDDHVYPQGTLCQRCGCWCGTLGNEPEVSWYIWHTLLWLREVRRCLRDDGVCWVVIADSYAGNASHAHEGLAALGTQYRGGGQKQSGIVKPAKETPGYADGSLLGIPEQVGLAAMADGWIRRDVVTWIKTAPMPESIRGSAWQHEKCSCLQPNRVYSGRQKASAVGHREHPSGGFTAAMPATIPDPDCARCGGRGRLETEVLRKGSWRHTRSTEVILHLTKQMGYWSNAEAVREDAVMKPQRRTNGHSLCTYDPPGRRAPSRGDRGIKDQPGVDGPGGRNPRNVFHEPPSASADLAALHQWLRRHCPDVLDAYQEDQRNPRNVVTPASFAHNLPHYAAFPPALVRRLIRATCPERCCPTCGMGWAPVVTTRTEPPSYRPTNTPIRSLAVSRAGQGTNGTGESTLGMIQAATVHGLRPSCTHYCTCEPPTSWDLLELAGRRLICPTCHKLGHRDHVPGVVLDPFLGSGTTIEVARALGRTGVGIEYSPTYIQLARQRLGFTALDAWHNGDKPRQESFEDLPLFGT